jgi:hypothetical protein
LAIISWASQAFGAPVVGAVLVLVIAIAWWLTRPR